MLAIMAERIRMIIDTDEDVRLAVRLAATKRDVSVSELINGIIRDALSAEIRDAKKYMPDKSKTRGERPDAGK